MGEAGGKGRRGRMGREDRLIRVSGGQRQRERRQRPEKDTRVAGQQGVSKSGSGVAEDALRRRKVSSPHPPIPFSGP